MTDLKNVKTATLHTSLGDIVIELFPNHAPKTVANFVELATGAKEWTDPRDGKKTTAKLYDGTIFHRVIDGFMIQGGDPLGRGTGGPGYRFDDEFHGELVFDRPYILAMANSGPATNGSQFFITVAPTTWLNRKHSIFGEVKDSASQAVVDAIATAKTGAQDKPAQDITINSVSIAKTLCNLLTYRIDLRCLSCSTFSSLTSTATLFAKY
jgi:peptidyl-prolyl cis-trans isomerase A (cyclophilin A)